MIILDTNVVSALMRPGDNPEPVRWIDRQHAGEFRLTAITIMEIRYGILRMAAGKRRQAVSDAFEHLGQSLFREKVLPFDRDAAEQAAEISAEAHMRGHNIDPPDSQIAGIARSRAAALATRNIRDFQDLEIDMVNPWEG